MPCIRQINRIMHLKNSKKYLSDFGNILRAMGRAISYSFHITPAHTLGVLIATIFLAVIPIIASWVNGKIIDALIASVGKLPHIPEVLVKFVIFSIMVSLLATLLDRLFDFFDFNMFYGFSRELDRDITEKFAYLDDEYYENPETNILLQKVRESYGNRPLNFIDGTYNLLSYSVGIITSLGVVIALSPLLIPLMILSTLPQFVSNVVFGKRKWGIWDVHGNTRRDYSWSRSYLSNYTSLQELRIFNLRRFLIERIYKLYTDFQNAQRKIENKRIKVSAILDIVRVLGLTLAFLFLVRYVLMGAITVGAFSFYISAIRQLQGALNRFFNRSSRIYEDGLYMVDIYKFMDLPKKIVSGKEKFLNKGVPSVQFKDLTFKYPGRDEIVIDNLNLEIKPGEHLAIVGENGAGKTTLIKLLMRFYDPSSGDILLGGKSLKKLDLDEWYKKVGVLFQEFNSYHFDAKTNIGVGNIQNLADLGGIISAAKKSGAHEFIENYENNYGQILNRAFDGGVRPSVGQWQKIALARAFFKDASILILDEPTSAIDPKSEFEIFEKLFEFAKGKTVIIISHRFSTVRNAQRIVVLDKGRIIEDGNHESLIRIKNGKYRIAFELQSKGYK
ncbi:MAG: ABC transporter ATP-binding protein [Patescibacteria group bacterium]